MLANSSELLNPMVSSALCQGLVMKNGVHAMSGTQATNVFDSHYALRALAGTTIAKNNFSKPCCIGGHELQ